MCVGHAACLAGAVPKKPKLVPAIAVDQFRYDYLTRFLMKMRAARWGSQSWLQPAFSRPSAEHEGSPMTQEPPERRPQRGPQGKIARPTPTFRGSLRGRRARCTAIPNSMILG